MNLCFLGQKDTFTFPDSLSAWITVEDQALVPCAYHSNNFTRPSHPQVAIIEGDSGLKTAPMHGPLSWARNFLKRRVLDQSQT